MKDTWQELKTLKTSEFKGVNPPPPSSEYHVLRIGKA